MTDLPSPVLAPPTPPGTIEPLLDLDSPRPGRRYRRRRLGLLAGVLVATLGTAFVAGGADEDSVPVAARGPEPSDAELASGVVPESASAPVTLAQVFAETTSTLLEATTTTLVAPTTSTTAPTPPAESPSAAAQRNDGTTSTVAPPAPSTTAAPAPARTVAKSPQPSPSTTAAPPTTAAPTTTTAPPAPAAPEEPSDDNSSYGDPNSLQVWLDLADCEAGGNWSINTGNGYYGGLQFSLRTWESVGGSGYPHEAPRDTQIQMGRRLQARQGWGAWPHCSEKLGLR